MKSNSLSTTSASSSGSEIFRELDSLNPNIREILVVVHAAYDPWSLASVVEVLAGAADHHAMYIPSPVSAFDDEVRVRPSLQCSRSDQ